MNNTTKARPSSVLSAINRAIEDPQKVMNFKKNANCLSVQAVRLENEIYRELGNPKEMTEEKARLAEQLKQAEEDATTDAKRQKQLDDILRAIDIDIVELTEFDDTFIRRIVEQVTILSKDKIEVRFIGGFSKVGDIPTK